MSFDKLSRGRRILGTIKSMVLKTYGAGAETYSVDTLHTIDMPGKWFATITRRTSSAEAAAADLAAGKWDFLHVNVGSDVVLALKFHDLDTELIRYQPGHWERWFGTYEISDVTPFPDADAP